MPPGTAIELRLKTAGFKLTPPRRAVLRVFAHEHEHLGPDEILKRGRKFCPRLGRATVYRTLELLTKIGVMRPIFLSGGRPAFTRVEGGHHHLVCSHCDRIEELPGETLATAVQRLARKTGFEIRSQLLEVYGLCAKCRRRK